MANAAICERWFADQKGRTGEGEGNGEAQIAYPAGCDPGSLHAALAPCPLESNLTAGIAAFKSGGHDGVIAFGGGSALDLGKLVAFQAGQTRPVWDFEDIGDWWARADGDQVVPIVAVPTTAGTGSEV